MARRLSTYLSLLGYVPLALRSATCATSSVQSQHGLVASTVRGMSSRASVHPFHSQQETLDHAKVVHGLLPNRRDFTAQFTPHGIMLLPKAILQAKAAASQHQAHQNTASSPTKEVQVVVDQPKTPEQAAENIMAELASIRAHLRAGLAKLDYLEEFVEDDDEEPAGLGIMARDKTLEWRRTKIKKHKIRKRRKATRHKNK